MTIKSGILYDTKDVATFLKVSPVTIKRYVADNRIKSIKINGLRRFKGDDILKLANINKNNSFSNGKLIVLDLFCGAGGLSYGFKSAGFDCLLGIDFEKSAVDTFKNNHRGAIGLCDDIRNISTKDIKKIIKNKKIHVICGGPPCQGFSTVGTNNNHDERNHLFLEFVRIVHDLTPDFIVLENVTGLLSKKNHNTLKSVFTSFENLGYNLDIKVLSAHYYGVPEKRRRTIIIGNKLGLRNHYPEKLFSDLEDEFSSLPKARTVEWAFRNLIEYRGKSYNHNLNSTEIKNLTDRNRLKHIKPGKGIRYKKDEERYLPKELWFGIDWSEIAEGRFRQTKLQRLDYKDCSPTINTSKNTYYHPTENRHLTPREAAAIQSFPAHFKFSGSITQQWKQIGNAVPPVLAEAIAKSIINIYKNKNVLKINKKDAKRKIEAIRSYAFDYKKRNSYQPSLF